jgi:hypothetical protein
MQRPTHPFYTDKDEAALFQKEGWQSEKWGQKNVCFLSFCPHISDNALLFPTILKILCNESPKLPLYRVGADVSRCPPQGSKQPAARKENV